MGKKIRIPLVLLAISAISLVAVVAMRDSVIINNGIRFYRQLLLALAVLTGIFAVLTAAVAAVSAKEQKKPIRGDGAENAAKREQGRLSPHRMDGNELRRMLAKNADGKWNRMSDGIGRIVGQMNQMDEYQASLKNLLEENEASALGDTEEILDKVEQNMFRNIRGALNFMNVADPSDGPKVREEISECIEKNSDLLAKTKDFMYALTDYLNGQGEDTSSGLLETYKETILETLGKQ